MASTPSPSFSSSLPPLKTHTNSSKPKKPHRHLQLFVASSSPTSEPSPKQPKRTPRVDTRIHWDNQEEGWLGKKSKPQNPKKPQTQTKQYLSEHFADLINNSSATHYQFLGVTPEADIEEIKAAYRKLSKEYHPDTTTLPLKTASEKFMRLREAYNVLSNETSRCFYDWTLAQEEESRREERMRMNLEDPYRQDIKNRVPVPDMVDRLGGKNMELSDQAYTALTIDIFIIFFCVCCFVYAAFFKEQY
ncbi:Molecular chaperone (DnaJ superfamily) domain-containing protein [Dioscorea alata]|uniref:Molecular chaperone (DnaJ superfamily) domain-containing protein n=1 Tax=Dioscorea alata TaxID=55571 RepID=A0ACB7VZX0_DIOAL|nr:Molecular chaperone (DnaJ superfamily) domain-containing protein [Dioscorea alata]